MKITIDIDGHATTGEEAQLTPSIPIPPPELLKRAKALGALNAGPPNLGVHGRITDLTEAAVETPRRTPAKKAAKRATRRKSG